MKNDICCLMDCMCHQCRSLHNILQVFKMSVLGVLNHRHTKSGSGTRLVLLLFTVVGFLRVLVTVSPLQQE